MIIIIEKMMMMIEPNKACGDFFPPTLASFLSDITASFSALLASQTSGSTVSKSQVIVIFRKN